MSRTVFNLCDIFSLCRGGGVSGVFSRVTDVKTVCLICMFRGGRCFLIVFGVYFFVVSQWLGKIAINKSRLNEFDIILAFNFRCVTVAKLSYDQVCLFRIYSADSRFENRHTMLCCIFYLRWFVHERYNCLSRVACRRHFTAFVINWRWSVILVYGCAGRMILHVSHGFGRSNTGVRWRNGSWMRESVARGHNVCVAEITRLHLSPHISRSSEHRRAIYSL